MITNKHSRELVAQIVQAAGGTIVGRTKLQKITYLLTAIGDINDFNFEYYHYGPYCEKLFDSAREAHIMGLLKEEERIGSWGGHYSIFESNNDAEININNKLNEKFIKTAVTINAVDLELAATAIYLVKVENTLDPWSEVAQRKPEKATPEHIEGAKKAYRALYAIDNRLPKISI